MPTYITVSSFTPHLVCNSPLYYIAAIEQVESQLHASSGDISWSISLFILIQGCFPLVWSAISEIYGRKVSPHIPRIRASNDLRIPKVVYIASFGFGIVGCVVAATAKSIGVLIGMRCVQAAG